MNNDDKKLPDEFTGPSMSSEQIKRIYKHFFEAVHKTDFRKNRKQTNKKTQQQNGSLGVDEENSMINTTDRNSTRCIKKN